ncbi:MAG: aspartate kinase [Planctomycetes bacterium]|nr:aspartate kinase [Planctomycetota bacterium]
MSLVVQKFGGSSVATAERIMNAARKAIRAKQAGHQVIVVVSARGDTTDELIDLAKEISEHPPAREMDMLLSTGEQISIALFAMAIQALGEKAISFTGAQVGIVTDSSHTKARIKSIDTKRLREAFDGGHIVIVAGFQGIDNAGNITTLGRGGSDTTAVALAAVMRQGSGVRSQESGVRGQGSGIGTSLTPDSWLLTPVSCDIYTDVDGIFTTDPRLVSEARKLDVVSYDEMLELASVGANVLSSRSIEFARKFAVPLQKRSSFSDVEGTWIVPEAEWMHDYAVVGAALAKDEARVAVIDVPDKPGVSHRIFAAIAAQNIAVDMIVQNVGAGKKATIGFTVPAGELHATLLALEPVVADLGARVQHEANVSKVSIVGTGMRYQKGVAQKMFAALAEADINLKMITTGDIKISVLVGKEQGVEALRVVHQAFGLDKPRIGAGVPVPPQAHKADSERGEPSGSRLQKEIIQRLASMEDFVVSDVDLDTEQGLIFIFHLPDVPGNCSRVFESVAEAGIVVDMIVENPSEDGRAQISFSVPRADVPKAMKVTRAAVKEIDAHIKVKAGPDIARLIVSGIGMRTHTGVASRMFGALAEHGINISMINTSEVRISVVVDRAKGKKALHVLRTAFGL